MQLKAQLESYFSYSSDSGQNQYKGFVPPESIKDHF